MLKHETDIALADAAQQGVLAVEAHLAFIRPSQARDDAQERGLARAGRSEQRDQFAGLDVEIDIVQGGKFAEALGDVVQSDLHGFNPLPPAFPARPWRQA